MIRPNLEVADVFHRYGDAFRRRFSTSLTTAQRRAMSAIERCRTAAPRRPDRTVRPLRPPPLLLSLLPQSPLPQVPGPCPRRLGSPALLRTARLPLLPPRLHPPSRDRRRCAAEPARRLHPPVPRRLPHPAHPRLRPQTPRHRDRLLRHPPYLGPGSSATPPPALRRPRRRHRSRR